MCASLQATAVSQLSPVLINNSHSCIDVVYSFPAPHLWSCQVDDFAFIGSVFEHLDELHFAAVELSVTGTGCQGIRSSDQCRLP